MPRKGQFGNRHLLVCPCGNSKMVRASYARCKYCSFACYLKYTKGYDHKTLGYRHTEEIKQLIAKLATERGTTEAMKIAYATRELRLSEEQKERRRQVLIGRKHGPMSEDSKQKISLSRIGKGYGGAYNFRGGKTGEFYAQILCPLGYIREYIWQWGFSSAECFHVDFGHPEAKTCIELDGPGHYHTPEEDAERDEILRHFGWHVIRIRHA